MATKANQYANTTGTWPVCLRIVHGLGAIQHLSDTDPKPLLTLEVRRMRRSAKQNKNKKGMHSRANALIVESEKIVKRKKKQKT